MNRRFIVATVALASATTVVWPAPQTDAGNPSSKRSVSAIDEPGRIYVQHRFELVGIDPDTKDRKIFGLGNVQDLVYQYLTSARLAPDGRRLAFGKPYIDIANAGAFPPNKILVRDITNSEKSEVLVEMNGFELQHWVWSKDGSKMAFASWDAKENYRNWIVETRDRKVEEVRLPRYKTESGAAWQMTLQDWSPDGTHFVAVGDGLHLVKADGSFVKRLAEAAQAVRRGTCRFSPDGAKLLYVVVGRSGEGRTLNILDVATGTVQPLVEGLNFTELRACWAPDSKRIAYTATHVGGNAGLETHLNIIDPVGKNSVTVLSERHERNEMALFLIDWR